MDETLLELVDGVYELVEFYKPQSPAQKAWKRSWLEKARLAGAGPDWQSIHPPCCFNCRDWEGKNRRQKARCRPYNLSHDDATIGYGVCRLWTKRPVARLTAAKAKEAAK